MTWTKSRSARSLLLAACLVIAASALPQAALAAVHLEIRNTRGDCQTPYEIFATGLPGEREVLVDMVVGGKVTGSVGGSSEPDGRFFSPIPRVLLPCETGGAVTANLRIAGETVASTEFDVTAPGQVLPLPSPGAPAAGNSPGRDGNSSDDWMFVSAIGAAVLLATLLAVLGGPRRR